MEPGERTEEVSEVLVNIEVDMLDLRTEGDCELELVVGHVPGVEVSEPQVRRFAPEPLYVLHHLTKHVTAAHAGQSGQPLHQLSVARH